MFKMLLSSAAFCGLVVQSFAQAPTDWQVRGPRPPAVELVSITYGSGGFILADDGNFVLRSSDGKAWSRHAGPLRPREVVYEEGRYVAVTWELTDGAIYTSTNGQTWEHQMTSLGDLASITYGNGLYVVAGDAGIWVSEDGERWSRRSEPLNDHYRDVVFGNGKFVAVGAKLTNGAFHQRIASSSNGVDWTFVTLSETNWLRAVAAGNGVFVASGDGRPILTSTDGEQWTAQGFFDSEPFWPPATDIRTITYGNGAFVAGGNGHRIYYSTNGTNWSGACFNCYGPSYTPFVPVESIAFGNGKFIAVAERGTMYESTDVRNWTIIRSENDLYGVAYGNGRFVAVGSNSTVWVSSNNGHDWTWAFGGLVDSRQIPIRGVAFGNNTFVAVGGPGSHIITSPDGTQWTKQLPGALSDSENLHGVTFGNGLFVLVGERSDENHELQPRIRTSDGTNWAVQSFPAPIGLRSLFAAGYGDGMYVVVGDQGIILSSPDGMNWTVRTSGTTRTLRAVVHHNGRFIVGGDTGTILTSTDGTSWVAGSPTSFSNRGLASGEGIISVGNFQNEGRLHYSHDGLSWPGNSQSFPEVLNGVAYGNGAWIAVGNRGLILQSIIHEIRLSNPRFSDGNFEMTIHYQPGRMYRIQASPDSVNWETLYGETATESTSTMRLRSLRGTQYFRVVSP